MGELLEQLVRKLRRFHPEGMITIAVDVCSPASSPSKVNFHFNVLLNNKLSTFDNINDVIIFVDSFKPLTYTALLKKGGM